MGDIRQEGGIWYIDINADGPNKSLKTHTAKRRVPVHSELIRLGFLDWIATKPEGQRSFLSFSFNGKEGYGRNLGRWFNAVFLPGLGLKESGLVFHCLRHTMVTRLAQAGVPDRFIKRPWAMNARRVATGLFQGRPHAGPEAGGHRRVPGMTGAMGETPNDLL